MTKRHIAIAIGAVVLVVGVVAGRERPSLELIEARAPASPAVAAADGIDLGKLRRPEAALPEADPFKRLEGAKEQSAAPGASKPAAPALPFQYFGRLTENGKTEVFVMRGDELLAIAPGQKLGDYRVDAIGASSIRFTYLPLKTKQILDFSQ